MAIVFDHSTLGQRVLFGTDMALDHVVQAIDDLQAQRVLLIADRFAMELSGDVVERAPIVARIHEIAQHVPVSDGQSAVALARAEGVDAVLAIGGGSSIGLAKFVARDTRLPIVAVPSTFAGSEATNVWGQTEGERKTIGIDDRVLPKTVVYDAALSRTLPASVAMASALNAIAHAVDGFWAPRVDPINTALGTEGLRALVPGARAMAADPGDVDARERTLYGAYLAAVAFASAGSGMHHKICHVLGGAYGLAHAEMHAIVLPYVVAFNAPAANEASARVRAAVGGGSASRGLYALRQELGVVASLGELGLKEVDVPEAASLSVEAIPKSNPRPFTVADVERIIRAAWAGDAIEE